MSADKHRRLALEVAYLRLAGREHGLALNIKWARGITDVLRAMIAAGDLDQRRVPMGGRKTVTTVYATAQGSAKLAAALARHGEAFGPVAGLSRIEPVRQRKEVRRRQEMTPRQRREERAAALARFERARVAIVAGIQARERQAAQG